MNEEKNITPFDNSESVIKVEHVSMRFSLNKEKVDNLKEYMIRLIKGKLEYKKFVALDDINFEIFKGDRLAILGFNGAGKSTLLKTIVGVYKPTEGKITKKGVIAPLLELGAGFDPNYTGRENIYLYGAILGYSRDYIDKKIDEIIEFSELGNFIEVPVKNYSSGMRSRLGFSIATAVEPDILILDEVLSVGDAKFRKKSLAKVTSMFDKGVTVLFVSHSIEQVKAICNKAILLQHGKIIAQGDVDSVSAIYEEMTSRPKSDAKPAVVVPLTKEEEKAEKKEIEESKKAIEDEKQFEDFVIDEIAKHDDCEKRYALYLQLCEKYKNRKSKTEEFRGEVKKLLEADLNAEDCPFKLDKPLNAFEALLESRKENVNK